MDNEAWRLAQSTAVDLARTGTREDGGIRRREDLPMITDIDLRQRVLDEFERDPTEFTSDHRRHAFRAGGG